MADGFYTPVGDYEGKTVAWQTWQPDEESTDCNSIFDFFCSDCRHVYSSPAGSLHAK